MNTQGGLGSDGPPLGSGWPHLRNVRLPPSCRFSRCAPSRLAAASFGKWRPGGGGVQTPAACSSISFRTAHRHPQPSSRGLFEFCLFGSASLDREASPAEI